MKLLLVIMLFMSGACYGQGDTFKKVYIGNSYVFVNGKGETAQECKEFTIWSNNRKIAYCECGSSDTVIIDANELARAYIEISKSNWRKDDEIDSLKKVIASFHQIEGIYPATFQFGDSTIKDHIKANLYGYEKVRREYIGPIVDPAKDSIISMPGREGPDIGTIGLPTKQFIREDIRWRKEFKRLYGYWPNGISPKDKWGKKKDNK